MRITYMNPLSRGYRNIIACAAIVSTSTLFSTTVLAASSKVEVKVNGNAEVNVHSKVTGESKQEIRIESKEEKAEIRAEKREEVKAQVKGITDDIKEKVATTVAQLERFLGKKALISKAIVSGKTDTTLTVTKDGKTYTITTSGKTTFRWRYWGKGSLADIQTGDTVHIVGSWEDEARTRMSARLIRDISIQKRFGVFVGNVTAVSGSTWTLQPVGNRPVQTVTITSSTAFFNRTGAKIAQADIAVGHRVRVKGLWDRSNNTVTQVSDVKDYTLPLRVTPTPTKSP